jgi:cancer susceptibility candidate protein 1
VDEVKFDKVRRIVEYRTTKLAPMAYVVDRCIDYPYKSWYLRCVGENKALLDLVTKRTTFVFEIVPGQVRLIERTDPELAHITNKPFAPGKILQLLQQSGINLLPCAEDAQLCQMQVKKPAAEERALYDIASSVNGFAFRSSVWNKSLPPGMDFLTSQSAWPQARD